jgi:hypothetical protein
MDDDSAQPEPETEREETLEDLDVPEDLAEDTKGGQGGAIKCT